MEKLFKPNTNSFQFFKEKRVVNRQLDAPKGNEQPVEAKTNKPQAKPTAERVDEIVREVEAANDKMFAQSERLLKDYNKSVVLAKRMKAKAKKERAEVAGKGSPEALQAYDICTKDEDYAFKNVEKRSKFKVLINAKMSPADWQNVANFLLVSNKAFITTYAKQHGFSKIPKVLSNDGSTLPSETRWAKRIYTEAATPKKSAKPKAKVQKISRADQQKAQADVNDPLFVPSSKADALRVLKGINSSKETIFTFQLCMKDPKFRAIAEKAYGKYIDYQLNAKEWPKIANKLIGNKEFEKRFLRKYPNG